jgi:hypothetical protein
MQEPTIVYRVLSTKKNEHKLGAQSEREKNSLDFYFGDGCALILLLFVFTWAES